MSFDEVKTRIERLSNSFLSNALHIRIKPDTLQFPITGKCNSKCSTCNIWKQHDAQDVDINELRKVIHDSYLSKVKNVGINGGEPFLHKNFMDVIECILELPSIQRIYLISNGLLTNRILDQLEKAHQLTKKKDVKILLTISLDGTDDIYTEVRGIPKGDQRVVKTLKQIKDNMTLYCESLTIGTTISMNNVLYLTQIEDVSKSLNIPVNYHIAVPNRRIYTKNDYSRYSIFEDEHARLVALEFFYGLFKYENNIKSQLLYYQNYLFIKNKGNKRLSACSYKKQDITLDEKLNVYFCAKECKKLGNALEQPIGNIVHSRTAKKEERRIKLTCNSCGHYITIPSLKCVCLFAFEKLKPASWIAYKLKCK